ncbi:MAG: ATP-binding protein, partial [Bacteroidales bacterium]|nr:ATP-binding protein [Bacteroidales bacterium]
MKISKIIIPNFQQFRNFQLDLTYPENHEKAGQPLDKVCFIGKNATGKTTLLSIIHELFNEVVHIPGTPSKYWFIVKFINDNEQFYKIFGHTSPKYVISENISDKITSNLNELDFDCEKIKQNLNKYTIND